MLVGNEKLRLRDSRLLDASERATSGRIQTSGTARWRRKKTDIDYVGNGGWRKVEDSGSVSFGLSFDGLCVGVDG